MITVEEFVVHFIYHRLPVYNSKYTTNDIIAYLSGKRANIRINSESVTSEDGEQVNKLCSRASSASISQSLSRSRTNTDDSVIIPHTDIPVNCVNQSISRTNTDHSCSSVSRSRTNTDDSRNSNLTRNDSMDSVSASALKDRLDTSTSSYEDDGDGNPPSPSPRCNHTESSDVDVLQASHDNASIPQSSVELVDVTDKDESFDSEERQWRQSSRGVFDPMMQVDITRQIEMSREIDTTSESDATTLSEIRTDYVMPGIDGTDEVITVEYLGRLCEELELVDSIPSDALDAFHPSVSSSPSPSRSSSPPAPMVTLAYLDNLLRTSAALEEPMGRALDDRQLRCDVDSGIWETSASGPNSLMPSPRTRDRINRMSSEESEHTITLNYNGLCSSGRSPLNQAPISPILTPALSMPSLFPSSQQQPTNHQTNYDQNEGQCMTLPRGKSSSTRPIEQVPLGESVSCQTIDGTTTTSTGMVFSSSESLNSEYQELDAYHGSYDKHTHWMTDLPQWLRDSPMCHLSIPGSHLSLAVDVHMRLDMDFSHCHYELADFLKKLPEVSVFKDIRITMKNMWRISMPKQCLTVGQQLEAGIRYFDMKVCEHNGTYYGEHGLYCRAFKVTLREMKTFLEQHPLEVVLLSFRRMIDLKVEMKRKLLTLIFQIFGARVSKATGVDELTLNDLSRKRKQVVVIFDESDIDDLRNHIFSSLVWSRNISNQSEDRVHTVALNIDEMLLKLDTDYATSAASITAASITECRKAKSQHNLRILSAYTRVDLNAVCGGDSISPAAEGNMPICRTARHTASTDTLPAVCDWLKLPNRQNVNIIVSDFVGCSDICSLVIGLNGQKENSLDSLNS